MLVISELAISCLPSFLVNCIRSGLRADDVAIAFVAPLVPGPFVSVVALHSFGNSFQLNRGNGNVTDDAINSFRKATDD